MNRQPRPIDDYALAAFITGKIPGKVREQIIEALQNDEDTRQLLAMAYEALSASHEPDEAMRLLSENWKRVA